MNEVMIWAWRKVAALGAESYEELTTPKRRRSRVHFRPSVQALEERWCPASVDMYWDPTVVGNNASNPANWDKDSLGSGTLRRRLAIRPTRRTTSFSTAPQDKAAIRTPPGITRLRTLSAPPTSRTAIPKR